uniref:Nuclear pore protein n=1 Tax=Ciona savignyi TaxID=51511 RepID=H2ZQU4_CIOSA
MLLGRLNSDGSRKPGAVDKYCGGDTKVLISKVAADTESKGLNEDAVHLYDLCGNHDQALTLLNRLLCPVVSSSDASHSDRARLKTLAIGLANRYRNQAVETSRQVRSTFHLLLDLLVFFDLYHANRVEQALDVVNELQMLPSTTEQVQSKVTIFKTYSDEIRQNISDILLATMTLLTRQCKQQQNLNKSVTTKSGDYLCANARRYARALITFAGMLPYHLPGDATARLVQLEVQMT